jgi:hypothetical protein
MSETADSLSTSTDAPNAAPSPATESQTQATPDSASAPSSSAPDSSAPSSGDTHRSDREGLLAAVRSVVQDKLEKEPDADLSLGTQDKDAAGEAGSQQAPPPDPQAQDKAAEAPLADPTEAELRKLKPETRKRFDQLLSQRDEARRAVTEAQPAIQAHSQLMAYLKDANLHAEDANRSLAIAATMQRGDWAGFLNAVMPYVQAAQEHLGLRLPPDLERQVSDGMMTEQAAAELARNRHRASRAEAEVQQHQVQAQQASTEQRVSAVKHEIDAWEMEIRRRDPDYPAKAGAVRRIGQALLQERGPPQSPQEARVLVQAAYDEATAMLLRARPVPQPTRRAPSGIHGTTQPAAVPKTMKEAVLMGLQNMQRAS